jgi:hypothetical protein
MHARKLSLLIQSHRLTFGNEQPSLMGLGGKLSSWLTRAMYPGSGGDGDQGDDNISRLYCASLILASFDVERDQCDIMQIENCGAYGMCAIATLGSIWKFQSDVANIVSDLDRHLATKVQSILALMVQKHGLSDLGPNGVSDEVQFECCLVSKNGVSQSGKKDSTGDIVAFLKQQVAGLNAQS